MASIIRWHHNISQNVLLSMTLGYIEYRVFPSRATKPVAHHRNPILRPKWCLMTYLPKLFISRKLAVRVTFQSGMPKVDSRAPRHLCSPSIHIRHPMMDNTATHDEIFIPPFMHTALRLTVKLPYGKGWEDFKSRQPWDRRILALWTTSFLVLVPAQPKRPFKRRYMTEFYWPLTTNIQHSWCRSRSRRVTALSRWPTLLMRKDYAAKHSASLEFQEIRLDLYLCVGHTCFWLDNRACRLPFDRW